MEFKTTKFLSRITVYAIRLVMKHQYEFIQL